ncbi:MAG: DUF4157 domain-containing protein [Draconibacterium sp.]|nr:DUF4157 domain-containing protein [Draconibacterium sp.]
MFSYQTKQKDRTRTIIQPKLRIGQPGDKYEQEADAVADRVMKMNQTETMQMQPIEEEEEIQMKCEQCEREEMLQTKSDNSDGFTTPDIDQQINSSKGEGNPLPKHTNEIMSNAFDTDFSGVNIHTDHGAMKMNRQLGSRAFTYGNDIYFNSGEYNPESSKGKNLLAHELTHTLQQNSAGHVIQREEGQEAVPVATATGTVEDAVFLVSNPSLETNDGLKAAINLLDRYRAHVPLDNVEFRVLPASDQTVNLGAGFDSISGRSHWENTIPVIELSQDLLNTAGAHVNRSGDASDLDIEAAHSLIRTIGHEMYHLWREKEGHSGNPIQPVYDAEASSRMERVRQNWLADIIEPGGIFGNPTRTSLGIDQHAVISTWEDIDESIRTQIEEGAASTDYINGLYMRSAYLVEEIYTKIEELTFVRVQQRFEPDVPRTASRQNVSSLASMVFRLGNLMNSMADPNGLITPTLLAQARAAMITYLRSRYPNRTEPGRDSYGGYFYFSAIRVVCLQFMIVVVRLSLHCRERLSHL